MICPGHAKQRHALEVKVGYRIRDLKTLLSNEKAMPHVFNFLHAMKRLKDTVKDLAMPI